MIGCLPMQALAFLAVFVYETHATQAIAFEWKPGLTPPPDWLLTSNVIQLSLVTKFSRYQPRAGS